jgi:predicted dehydrogenase
VTAAGRGVPRFGVAGAGSLGFHHVRILSGLPGVVLSGFFDVSAERSAEVSGKLGATAFRSLDELLREVDALVIATPTTTHAATAESALRKGVHVFIEKPIAATLEEADRIIWAASRSGALVQVGHVERFNSAVVGARPYLDEPLFIESHRLAPFTERGTDVAVVRDLMIHDVDLVASLVGHPIEDFQATGIPVLTPSVDIANARLRFLGGAVANLTASRVSAERMRKLRIFQRSGYLSLNLADGTGEFLRLKGGLPALGDGDAAALLAGAKGGGRPLDLWSIVERIRIPAQPGEPLQRELESFRDAVSSGGRPVVTADEGRAALATALEIEGRILTHVAHTTSA